MVEAVVTEERQPRAEPEGCSLRERKRLRTRAALVRAAADLFARKGYDETTLAEIAAAAEVSTRTFFSYFTSKEELLFPDSASRARAAVDVIAARDPKDRPVDVLLRALQQVVEVDTDMVSPMAAVRTQLILTVPAVRGRALQIMLTAQQDIARELHAAYPEELDEVTAAALVGAWTGAITGALLALLNQPASAGIVTDPESLRDQVRRATEVAMRPWTS
jgi:AcrR family transcriptional regulator